MIPMRPILRDLIGNVLYASGVTRPARVARNHLNIVTFHRILPEEKLKTYPDPGNCGFDRRTAVVCPFLSRPFRVCATCRMCVEMASST